MRPRTWWWWWLYFSLAAASSASSSLILLACVGSSLLWRSISAALFTAAARSPLPSCKPLHISVCTISCGTGMHRAGTEICCKCTFDKTYCLSWQCGPVMLTWPGASCGGRCGRPAGSGGWHGHAHAPCNIPDHWKGAITVNAPCSFMHLIKEVQGFGHVSHTPGA